MQFGAPASTTVEGLVDSPIHQHSHCNQSCSFQTGDVQIGNRYDDGKRALTLGVALIVSFVFSTTASGQTPDATAAASNWV